MQYAIIGGSGYIGYHIAVELVTNGHSVLIYDISQPDAEWVQDAEEQEAFRKQRLNLRFLQGDILSVKDLTQAMTGADCVIHCGNLNYNLLIHVVWVEL